jgi:hypothetical protein
MEWFWLIIFIILMLVGWGIAEEQKKVDMMSPEEQKEYRKQKKQQEREQLASMTYGAINPVMVCPHCQAVGRIRTKDVKQKKGVSGGKATAAVLTAGVSLLAVGLSRKETATQAHCDNCQNTWFF